MPQEFRRPNRHVTDSKDTVAAIGVVFRHRGRKKPPRLHSKRAVDRGLFDSAMLAS
jgi:hypothetical protein